jgi:uncharacterized protein
MSTTIAQPTPVERGRAVAARATAALRTETGLARVALGAVALHTVDDAFLQPNPGTSAADHLAGGLIPTALLLATAWFYPRLRAGLRAALALLFGFLGILAGIEAVVYARQGALSGDDYTGLLSLAAGLVLLGVGAATLWRSRRTDDHLAWRYPRRLLLTAGGFVLAFVFLLPIAVGYFSTHVGRAEVPAAKLGAAHENVSFETSDGLTLKGWFVPSKNGATVISFPGRKGPQKQARMLIRHGYGALLFDRRGEGESDGDPNMFGWTGGRDLHAAVEFLKGRPDVDPERIGGVGLSVGGEMMIQAAAESTAFKAIVSEGGSERSVRDTLANGDNDLDAILSMGPSTVATALFGNDTPPPTLKSLARRISPRALFLIYAKHGQGGTETGPNKGFYAEAGEPKQIWEVPEGAHIGGIDARPKEYERRVVGFFDRALLKKSR